MDPQPVESGTSLKVWFQVKGLEQTLEFETSIDACLELCFNDFYFLQFPIFAQLRTVAKYFKFQRCCVSLLCANTFCVRRVASASRLRRALKRVDCRLWKWDLCHQHNPLNILFLLHLGKLLLALCRELPDFFSSQTGDKSSTLAGRIDEEVSLHALCAS